MVLSDNAIRDHISTGEIVITPFNNAMLKPGSYSFTLNSTLLIPKTEGIIDAESTNVLYDEVLMKEDGYVLEPGEFILGQTYEKLSLSKRICCILDSRTSLVRIGLCPLQGSTFIEPGQEESHETLEISNISKNPIRIYVGMKIVKGIFFLLSSEASHKYVEIGKYAKQSRPERIINR